MSTPGTPAAGTRPDPVEPAALPPTAAAIGRDDLDRTQTTRALRSWWDSDADQYHAEHGQFLGEADFVWSPERLREADAALLGPLESLTGGPVLEIGAGSAKC
jgi:hypothetical protein